MVYTPLEKVITYGLRNGSKRLRLLKRRTNANKPLGRGYALVTDIIWKAYLARALVWGVASGISTGTTAYVVYRDPWRAVHCGFYAFGIITISAFVSPFFAGTRAVNIAGSLGTVAGPLGVLAC